MNIGFLIPLFGVGLVIGPALPALIRALRHRA
jgi:hypothetical protein